MRNDAPQPSRRLVAFQTHPFPLGVFALWLCLPFVWMATINTVVGQDNNEDEPLEFSAADLEHFETKVRPILANHCYDCHGPDLDEPDGGLFVSSRKNLLQGGDSGPAIHPGKPDESFLIEVVEYGGVIEMPPDSRLSDDDIQTLSDWIKRGAPWPSESDEAATAKGDFDIAERKSSHWCWEPVRDWPLPTVSNQDWPRQPLDRFILSRLETQGLHPAQPADRSTWLRRVTFDLTGLPPTLEERDAFLNDTSEEAFAKVVDRLLDSPAFGERWARHWMDLVRYAETCGHEFDYPIPYAYRYRDYLIRAFNNDVPYDQLIREHVAGDLLETPRLHPQEGYNESVIGTGFWFLGEAVHAPVDVRADEATRIDNQIDVMTKTFLGLTVACARCHDHKFDAISTKDYYALSGFMQSSRRNLALLDPNQQIASRLEQLRELDSQVNQTFTEAIGAVETVSQISEPAEWAREITAVGQVMSRWQASMPTEPQQRIDPELDLVFEDFESGSYGDWIAEGTAFGSHPQSQTTLAQYQGNVGAVGTFFVNSHSRTADEGGPGDQATGTLTSPEFVISHRFLHFLVGGGSHVGKTCVDVVVDNKTVASQTGFNQNAMSPVVLDLGPWVGKTARIRIVDQEQGGWGNIGADRFVFSNSPRLDLPRSLIRAVAEAHDIDQTRLEQWFLALHDPSVRSLEHPASPLARIVASLAKPGHTFDGVKSQWLSESSQRQTAHASVGPAFFSANSSDPNTNDLSDWFPSGQGFAEPVGNQGNWRPAIGHDGWEYVPAEVASSQRRSRRTWGVLRSPTFELQDGTIWLQLAGSDLELRVIIDGFTMGRYNGLLFSHCFHKTTTEDRLNWVALSGDIGRYVGHRAHIEIIDHGNAGFDLRQVRFGSNQNATLPSQIANRLWDQADGVESLTKAMIDELAQAGRDCMQGSGSLDQSDLLNWALEHDLIALPQETRTRLSQLLGEYRQAEGGIPAPMTVQALTDGTPENEQVFIRGNHRLLGETAPRQMLTALCEQPWPEDLPTSGRLRLANEIADPDNPLTARVMANRIWHHLLGRGLVESVDNFGVLGTEPTHPELLDHLSQSLVAHDWSLKALIREICLSQTYRMSSQGDAAADTADPTNQLWHRANVRRLSAEAIRDSLLSVSGELNPTLYGPSVRVYLSPFMEGRGRPGSSGPVDGDGRRSIYVEVRRNFLSPMMLAFDSPIPFSTVGRRNISNVPAQALILMNDPFVYDQSGKWANRLLDSVPTAPERLDRLYLMAFNRLPNEHERTQALEFLEQQGEARGIAAEERANHPQVWQDLCHVICNVKEFTYVN